MDFAKLQRLYELTRGRGWEPPNPKHPLILDAIAEGFLRRVDGRCGFERFRDSMVTWTGAGHAALSHPVSNASPGNLNAKACS